MKTSELWRWLRGTSPPNDSLKSYNGTEGLNLWKPNIMLVYPCGSSVYNIFFEGFTCIRDVHAHPCDVPKQGMTIPYYIESTCNMNQQTTWHNMTTIYAIRGQSIWHMELID